MRNKEPYRPLGPSLEETIGELRLRTHFDRELRRLSDYIDQALDRTVRYGPVPGAYYPLNFSAHGAPLTDDSFIDVIVLASERKPISLSWFIRGSGVISCDLVILANAGSSILGTTPLSVSGTDSNANVLSGAGTFNTDRIGVVSAGSGAVWLSVTNIVGTLTDVHVVLETKQAGEVK